jgi:GTP 3',8-cyclase
MLQDRFGRSISYLRVSVTDRCDLRCSYCMPKGFSDFEEPAHWLTFDEMTRLIGLFAQAGVGRVRLTGGEPLLRKDLPLLAARIAALPGIRDLSLSTNATQLEKHAVALKAAGVSRINVSLDSLEKACLEDIVGKAAFERIMAGIMAGKAVGFDPIKINMVAMRGVNDHEIENMAAFCLQNGFILRLIEAMPMGDTGRNAQYMPLDEVRDSLVARLGLEPEALELGGGPARYWKTSDGSGRIGFITPISQHFCATCNRIRLAVDGTLYMCLGQEEKFSFRPLLRGGASDTEILAAIAEAIELKPEKHEFRESPLQIVRFMSQTGG